MSAKRSSTVDRSLQQRVVNVRERGRDGGPESRIPLSQVPISQLPVSQIPPSRIGLPHAEGTVTTTGGVLGAAAGALAGAIAGPIGAIAGAALGAMAGAVAGRTVEEEQHLRDKHEESLDKEIGVIGGDIGIGAAPGTQQPTMGAFSAASAGAAGAGKGEPDAGGRGD